MEFPYTLPMAYGGRIAHMPMASATPMAYGGRIAHMAYGKRDAYGLWHNS